VGVFFVASLFLCVAFGVVFFFVLFIVYFLNLSIIVVVSISSSPPPPLVPPPGFSFSQFLIGLVFFVLLLLSTLHSTLAR
jgi:hypothetical protein